MRKLIVSTIISVDGYHEGPGKDVLALPFDRGFSAYDLERLRAAETLIRAPGGLSGRLLGRWRVPSTPQSS